MTGGVEKAVLGIKQGKRYPVYLLHGDEFLTRGGAKAIIQALVPAGQEAWSVETIVEEADLASLPLRLNTLPLFGGTKVVAVYDSKAFLSKQTAGNLTEKSLEAWQAGDQPRAVRLLLQVVAAAGGDAAFLERAARGETSESEWKGILSWTPDPEREAWLRETAGRAVADGAAVPEKTGSGLAQIYEETLLRGISPAAALVLTAEVVDQRRTLFKRLSDLGFVIDCGVRSKRAWETQMNPEMARAKIREVVKDAKKSIDPDAVTAIVDRTGASVRALQSELEKILLYIGTRPTVTTTDVMAVLSSSREANVFDLTNALGSRDAGQALDALRSLFAQREPIPRILGTIANEIRSLLVARCVLDARFAGQIDRAMAFPAFQARMLPRLKEASEGDDGSAAQLAEMHPFRAFQMLRSASRFSQAELLRALEMIHETDLALKTSGHPESLLLEQLLITMCGG